MTQQKTSVLFLPKWYPNEIDPFDGNFIENHAQSIALYCKVDILFVHSSDQQIEKFRFELNKDKPYQELRVYYKKPNSPLPIFNKIISLFRYKKAQRLGYQRLYPSKTPDLVHVHVLSRPALLALHLKRKGIPFLITEHWSGYLPENGAYKGFFKKIFTSYVVKRAAALHSVSTPLKEAMENHKLFGKYTVIPNVVDEKLFVPLENDSKKVQIIFVGNLLQSPKKILDIIKGMATLKESFQNFILSIYGEGKDQDKAQELVKNLNLQDHIVFQGTRDRNGIAEAIANSHFLVLFSEFENQPCVISEALSCGIPIIVPDLPGIKERMKAELGYMVETGKQVEFEEALLKMCLNHKQFDKNAIHQHALETYSEPVIGQAFMNLYQEILSNE